MSRSTMIPIAAPAPPIVRPRPNPRAALRLLCLPYAGGGASVFRTWPAALPAEIEVLAFEPPGHESRGRKPLLDQLPPLVTSLADALAAEPPVPLALYGHSLGALVAFALARELRRRGLASPVHLFVAARRAPHIQDPLRVHTLPDTGLTAWLRGLGGVPDAVLKEPELLSYFLPILRADLALNHHELPPGEPLDCPITAFGGVGDTVATPAQLDAWRIHTRGAFERHLLPGGHFFLQSSRTDLLAALARPLAQVLAAR